MKKDFSGSERAGQCTTDVLFLHCWCSGLECSFPCLPLTSNDSPRPGIICSLLWQGNTTQSCSTHSYLLSGHRPLVSPSPGYHHGPSSPTALPSTSPSHCCAWPPTLLSLLESDSPGHLLVQTDWETGKRNPRSQGCEVGWRTHLARVSKLRRKLSGGGWFPSLRSDCMEGLVHTGPHPPLWPLSQIAIPLVRFLLQIKCPAPSSPRVGLLLECGLSQARCIPGSLSTAPHQHQQHHIVLWGRVSAENTHELDYISLHSTYSISACFRILKSLTVCISMPQQWWV